MHDFYAEGKKWRICIRCGVWSSFQNLKIGLEIGPGCLTTSYWLINLL